MLSDKQRTAIVIIVAGRRFTEVEKQVRVSHSQCSRWRRNPEFAAELHEARMRFHEAAEGQIMEPERQRDGRRRRCFE